MSYFTDIAAKMGHEAREHAADLRTGPAIFDEMAKDAILHSNTAEQMEDHGGAVALRKLAAALHLERDRRLRAGLGVA